MCISPQLAQLSSRSFAQSPHAGVAQLAREPPSCGAPVGFWDRAAEIHTTAAAGNFLQPTVAATRRIRSAAATPRIEVQVTEKGSAREREGVLVLATSS